MIQYRKTIVCLAALWMVAGSLYAKETKYKVSDIPKSLRENSYAVVRNQEIVVEVKSLTKTISNVTYAITILNKNGLQDANFQEFYDQFTKITGIKGRVFDENGEQLKKIPAEDILDYSAISGFSIYEDTRVKFINPKVRNFPFTVEYTWEQSSDGLFTFPSWNPQPKFNLAVERSSYKAIVNKGVTFRYTERNTAIKATLTSDNENNIYFWQAINLPAMEMEPYSLPAQEILPFMMAAPSDFEMDGHKGNLSSWENFGKFISSLNTGKNVLDEETKKLLKELVASSNDDFDKIKRIYEYMQGRTRYVSVQVGIGGYQPFDAATVQRLAYGDCKALTNYMKTMLEVVGIKSNYCLVNAGETAPKMIREFPSSQFNHAFLSVPLKNDTLWLECTSQRMPCGFIGDFTDDRDVLLIDDKKSKVVHTKSYGLADNVESRTSHVTLDENGKGTVEMRNVYKGLKYDHILSTFLADDTDKKRLVSERMKFPGFQVRTLKYRENKALIPSIEENLQVDFENYLNLMGSRYLLLLNFSNSHMSSPANLRSRRTEVYVKRPSLEIDTIVYALPSIMKPESLPKPISIQTAFGNYQAKVEFTAGQLSYIRSFQLNKGLYPASSYNDFVNFFDQVAQADEMRCALIKN